MSEFGGLWKHKNLQHAFVPPKMDCGCPSGGGVKNGHIRYPSYGGMQKKKKKILGTHHTNPSPVSILSSCLFKYLIHARTCVCVCETETERERECVCVF